jgi:transcriptional regulator with PAS, ATPase and Fis domain
MESEALEEELFGSEGAGGGGGGGGGRGSGAEDRPRRRRAALVEIAEHGTLFLDEVVGLEPRLQPRLLKLLEARTYRRAGGVQEVTADVRVIASTSRDLVEEVNAGRLREELYYRLSVMPVHLPPLRARAREDLVDLIARMMHELQIQVRSAPSEVADSALEVLLRYPWPGNLRELRNVLERAMIMARGGRRVGAEHLPSEVRRASGAGLSRHVPRSLAEVERAHIERTLRAHNANRTRAARELGISRATLINKIKMYHLGEMVTSADIRHG